MEMSDDQNFWKSIDQLVEQSQIIIDRPAGTAHPRYPDFIYPYDYGYLAGTQSMDQGGIDIWAGSLPDRRPTALICTVDQNKKDSEIKILLGCTKEEAQIILKTHNSGAQAGILIWRD
jgi:inorganic pyrophosphatase